MLLAPLRARVREEKRAVWTWCALVAVLVRSPAGEPAATPAALAALAPLKGQHVAATMVLQLLLAHRGWRLHADADALVRSGCSGTRLEPSVPGWSRQLFMRAQGTVALTVTLSRATGWSGEFEAVALRAFCGLFASASASGTR